MSEQNDDILKLVKDAQNFSLKLGILRGKKLILTELYNKQKIYDKLYIEFE